MPDTQLPRAQWPDAHVCIVDDEADNVDMLVRLLSRAGYTRVVGSTKATDLLRRFPDDEPDLVLLDLVMPVTDGYEVLRRLGEVKAAESYLPVVVLTGDTGEEARKRALELGAQDFVTKPFELTEVLLRVRNLLQTRRQHLQLLDRKDRLEHEVHTSKEDLELFRTVLGQIHDPVIIEDPQERAVIYVNPAAADVVLRRDRGTEPLRHGGLVDHVPAIRDGRATTEHFEAMLGRTDGTEAEVDVGVAAIVHGGRRLLVGVARDISARKAAERQLVRAAEREHQAAEHLRRLDEVKNALLTAVSHELRTPLTVVLGIARTLEARWELLTADHLRELGPRLNTHAQRLERLLDDLLDLDPLTRGDHPLRVERTDLSQVIREVVAETEPCDHAILTELTPVEAEVDRVKFERIVANLVSNGIRHTPPGSTITVTLTGHDPVELAVADDGPGVPEDFKRRLFEPFARHDLAASKPGLGLGMSLVRVFTELHNGDVWVEDNPGGGACFRVKLPAIHTSPARPAADVRV